jgi:hypothetical protein
MSTDETRFFCNTIAQHVVGIVKDGHIYFIVSPANTFICKRPFLTFIGVLEDDRTLTEGFSVVNKDSPFLKSGRPQDLINAQDPTNPTTFHITAIFKKAN